MRRFQLFTEGRSGQISDVWLDMSGVLFGTCLTVGFGCFLTRWKKMAGKNCGTENRGINENDRISGKTFRKKTMKRFRMWRSGPLMGYLQALWGSGAI